MKAFNSPAGLRTNFVRYSRYITIPDEVFGELTVIEATVYGFLRGAMNERKKTDVTNAKIKGVLGISERSIQNSISSLTQKGYIKAEYFRRNVGIYRVVTILK